MIPFFIFEKIWSFFLYLYRFYLGFSLLKMSKSLVGFESWVIDDKIYIFGRTDPLSSHLATIKNFVQTIFVGGAKVHKISTSVASAM